MEGSQLTGDVRKLKESLGQLPEPVAKPHLVVLMGLPGTGKSYLCCKLAERLPLAVLESDSLRKVLFPYPRYTPRESAQLFHACHKLIAELLERGIPLILDATNLEERHREYLYHIAEQNGARLILVRVEAPPEVVRQRLEKRARGVGSATDSEADWEVYQRMKHTFQRVCRNHFVVDTSKDIAPALEKIVRETNRC